MSLIDLAMRVVAICRDCAEKDDDLARGTPPENVLCDRCAEKPADRYVWTEIM